MKLRWTTPAVADLENIHAYIANDSPRYASILIQKIIVSIENISHFPLIGRIVPELGNDTIREILVHPYRIVYRIHGGFADIVTIIHQSRNLNQSAENM